jgi:hypothetical protein
MKKIFEIRFLLLIFALMMQFSCSKNYLELLPTNGLVSEEFWKTKEDVQAMMMGAYQTSASMNGVLFTYGEARGDLVSAGGNVGSRELNLMGSNIYPDNTLCNWNKFYQVINYCNDVIVNAPKVQKIDKTFPEFQSKAFMAEAVFLRSLNYFYLVRLFKDVPLVLEPSENDAVDFYPPVTKGEEVLQAMIKDLDEYRIYAPDSYKSLADEKGRATKGAFDSLLADISLWNFDYAKCIEYCDRVISNKKFVLMPGARWFEIFYPGNSLEGIFEFQFNDQFNQPNDLYYTTSRYSNEYAPSQTAIKLFAKKYATELTRGEDASITKLSEDVYQIWKYVGRSPDGKSERSIVNQNSCNLIVYRLSDIYLMKAEALSQLNQFNDALDLLNTIRERANVAPITLNNSANAFEDAILQERALEFAFEGKRWFDLLRMGRRNNYARKDKLVEILINNVPALQKRILAAKLTNPLGWYLPIYKGEIERNKNLVQNSYYKI